MESWNEHEVTFAPAEGLENNETSIRVLDQKENSDAQKRNQSQRITASGQDADPADVNDFQRGLELEEKIREDPGYKFLMMVAAFASRRLGKLVASTGSGHNYQAIDNICAVVAHDVSKHWMQEPEISGVVYLSPDVYGHIKEAQSIVNRGFSNASLKMLVEQECYATLFARLVSIRMGLSSTLFSQRPNVRDRSFTRLHQEQTAVLRSIRCARGTLQYASWTRPSR
jgi:hypothetical protein|tara:strand:+ start:1878 stop:2558 length:681 start_codon:yes stop_codon:yes gene_type:complete